MNLDNERRVRFEEREKLLQQIYQLIDNMRAIAAICHDNRQMSTLSSLKEYLKQLNNGLM